MNANPLVSIIIDNYNYAQFLGDAIDSALAQTYPHTEVIVVDDGSTDRSREVIAGYGDRITAIVKTNGGQASAFNVGFVASNGHIVVLLDADDYLMRDALEEVVPLFSDREVSKAHWPMRVVDENGLESGPLFPAAELPDGDFRDFVRSSGPTHLLSAPNSGNAWARWFLNELFPLPEELYRNGCDTCLFEAAPFFGVIRSIETPLTCYRQHEANDHVAFTVEAKVARELGFFEHYAPILAASSRRAGVAVDIDSWRRTSWWHRHQRLIELISQISPPGAPITVIDDATLEVGPIGGHECVAFSLGDLYLGAPDTDVEAIALSEHMRSRSVRNLVIAWPAFWWLDHYPRFREHLFCRFRLLTQDDVAIVFDLGVTIDDV